MHSGDEGAAGCEALLWTAVEMEFTSEFHQRRHVLHVGVPRSDAVRPATLQRGGVGVHDKFPEEAEVEGVACVGLSEGFLSHPTWFPFRVSCSFPYNTLYTPSSFLGKPRGNSVEFVILGWL